MSDCDCERVLANVQQALAADLRGAAGEVTHDPLPVLRADPVLLAELFQNLIQNSIRYRGDAPPRVHVSASRGPEGWRFSVKDNGVGIAPSDAARIFEPFRQGRLAEPLIRELIDAVLSHIRQEEEQLFPELKQAALDLTSIGLEMQAFEANLVHLQAQISDRGARR